MITNLNGNITRNLIDDDSRKVQFEDRTMTVGELRQLKPDLRKEVDNLVYNLVIFWDDTIQYTSLGLLYIYLKTYNITDYELDVDKFITRPGELSSGLEYVQNELKLIGREVSLDELATFQKEHYGEILLVSMKSKLDQSIFRMNEMFPRILFVFEYNDPVVEQIIADLRTNILFDFINISYTTMEVNTVEDLMLSNTYQAFLSADMLTPFSVMELHGLKNLKLLGPSTHNGIHPAVLVHIRAASGDYTITENNNELIFYKDGY